MSNDAPAEIDPPHVTVVMPCLNEAETLATCIRKAHQSLTASGISHEIVVADNGSTDGSQQIALDEGARVVDVPERGYGAALIGGIAAARSEFVVMGDADDSYDFTALEPFIERLESGDDLVMGNRFAGGIKPGAMPWLHRYIGNPVLSAIGRVFFRAPVRDFHCGLRAFRRSSMLSLNLRTTGMEFASEMVVKSCLAGLRISEVPTTLSPDGRSRPPHLRSFRDGWRHLRFLLLYSPRWLFLYPGLLATIAGLVLTVILTAGPIEIGSVGFDIGTLLYAVALTIVGYQAVLFAVLSRAFARTEGLLPPSPRFDAFERRISLEKGILVGLAIFLFGVAASIASFMRWRDEGYGSLVPDQTVRTIAPAVLGLALGAQTMLGSLFYSLLDIRVSRTNPMALPVSSGDQAATPV